MNRVMIFCSLALSFLILNLSSALAQETGFLEPGKASFLYLDNRELNDTYGNESIKFTAYNNGLLQLTSKDGTRNYLSFTSYDGSKGGVGYSIRKIYTIFPSMEFYEITADVGAHAKNCGYWIVGKHNGKWVTFVSIDNLAKMGYTPHEWHQIHTKINSDATGRFILTSSHEYMPAGATYGYERKHAVDLRLQLFWDQKAQWFGMRKL